MSSPGWDEATHHEKVLFKQFLSNNLDVLRGLPPTCRSSTSPSFVTGSPSTRGQASEAEAEEDE